MPKAYDLTGQRFGKLVAIEKTVKDKTGDKWFWKCLCDCGKFSEIRSSSLVKKGGGTESCGCLSKKYFIDLTNQKFNRLTIVKHLGKNNYNNHIYECLCDCGGIIKAEGTDIKTERVKSCGRCTKSINSAMKLPYGEMLYNVIYNDYRIKAGQREIDFQLDKDVFLIEIQKNCHYCGSVPMNTRRNKSEWKPEQVVYTGLDRIDNERGYVTDNVVPCCFICNQAKHRLPYQVFLDWVDKVHYFQKSKKSNVQP